MGKRVVVLGAGVAGLTAAQELAERGFDVVLLERHHRGGGKARSIQVEPTRLGPHPYNAVHPAYTAPAWAPGEHGFRFFPGFYRHVIDTMARIPTSDGGTAADGLVSTSRCGFTQYGKPMFELPSRFPDKPNDALQLLQLMLVAFSPITDLDPSDFAHFAARTWQIMTTCPDRRLAEYEKYHWWDYIGAENRSAAYQKFLASGFTRSLVASKARQASARTVGDMFLQLMFTVVDPLAGSTDRVLMGPTSHVWIDAWQDWLSRLGVEPRWGVTITGFRCDGHRITGVTIESGHRTEVVTGDYYVAALPIERMAALLTPAMLHADPRLASLTELAKNVEWMNGIQFYLRRPMPVLHGHLIHIDTEWALTSVSQFQFWQEGTIEPYEGEGEVKDILSVDISDWEGPGLNGKPAKECTRQEVADDTWGQLKLSLEHSGAGPLRDVDLADWFLDPDIKPGPSGLLQNAEPLLVNLADTWRLRPEAVTGIPNLFLASDYVRTYTDLATMEGANEAARRAVNGLLEASGVDAEPSQLWPLEEPSVLAPFREYDAARYKLGLPWDTTLVDYAASALAPADPALKAVPELMGSVEPFVTIIEEVKLSVAQAQRALDVSDAEHLLGAAVSQMQDYGVPTGMPVIGPAQISADLPPGPSASTADAVPRSSGAAPAPATPSGAPAVPGEQGPPGFLERLEWYRQFIGPAMEQAVPDREPRRYLYEPMREFIARPAKALRPALCLATCRSYGGTVDDAIPSAAGLELLHHAFLVHDDVEDGSLKRRGGSTVHRQIGEALAINAGDALNAYAMRMFRSNLDRFPPERALAILDEVDHLFVETLEGQAVELGWQRGAHTNVGVEDYLRMVLKKTAWYSFIHPMRIGALVAGAPAGPDLDRFNRFGFLLGAAFQIQDDVLNLTGATSRYGKEIGGDLWEGKRTMVLAHSLSHASPGERRVLEQFLSRPREERLPRQVSVVSDILEQTGALHWARSAALALVDGARQEFETAFGRAQEGADLDFLRSMPAYLVERDV